jgi:putative membrane protein
MFLAAMGTIAIVMGTIEYWQTVAELRQFRTVRLLRPPFVMAVLMSIAGLVLFFSIITRIL